MLTSLDHVVIAVRDLRAATATYTALLGRGPSWSGGHPRLGTANSLFRLDNTYIELLSAEGAGSLADGVRQHLAWSGEGPFAIAFGTPDAAACAAEFRARGLAASDPVDGEGQDAATGAVRSWRSVYLPIDATRGVPLFAIEHRSLAETLPPVVPADGDAAAAVHALDHAVIMTVEPDVGCALYRDRLGLRLALDHTFEARRVRLLFFRIGGVTVELAAPLGEGGIPGAARDRLWGLSYRVRNVAAARARVAAAGFDASEVRPGNKPGTHVCSVRGETHGVATLFIAPDQQPNN